MNARIVHDQLNRTVDIPTNPNRIVSLVPSQTELLFSLGLRDRIAGRTKFCIHPQEEIKDIPIVGGTKNFRFDVIDQLNPDLIIANKEENYQEGIERLSINYPVWISDIQTFQDSQDMILSIGHLTNTDDKAADLTRNIEEEWSKLPNFQGKSVIYLIWKDPWIAVGQNTFIDTVIQLLGLANDIDESRYPQLPNEISSTPDYVFLSTEPYPFREGHIPMIQKHFPQSKVCLVDGEYFSWYGSRLLHAPHYFQDLYESIRTRNKPQA